MAYASGSELQTRLGTTLYNELGDSDTSRQAQWISDADAEIDGYLSTRVATPINTGQSPGAVPKLRQLSLAIATFNAYANKPPVPEVIEKRYESAIEWLRAFEKGDAELPVTVPIEGPTAMATVAKTYGDTPTFTTDDMARL